MSEKTIEVKARGIGLFGLLGVLFIGLKLTNFINWSWWLVLLPLYGPFALIMLILGGAVVAHVAFSKK